MPLANGRHFLSIPGPSVMPDEVLRAMHRPATNIYEGALIEMTHGIVPDLKRVARTESRAMTFIGNGHAVWEAVIVNTLDAGEKALVLESGRFAVGWGEVAKALGVEIEVLNAPDRGGVDPQMVEDRLRTDTKHEIKAVLVVQIDTASGVWNDIAAIRRAIDAAGHPALYMVDCMASIGCVPYEMDAWGVDVTTAGSQKGLMTPPGLGFAWASQKAWDKTKTLTRGRAHWAWELRAEPEVFYQLFHGTAPVQHLYALRQALDMIFAEGLEAVWARHAAIGRGVRAAVSRWGENGPLELNILDPDACSDSVTTIRTGAIDAQALRACTETKLNVTLGTGLGELQGITFRIGHMGHVNAPMILGTLGSIELALAHMGAPYAPGGVEAAIAAMKDDVA
ncbi:aminotransferase class V-fold PLP-dependent enzyme [Pikeienuella piscinae]|uniref:Aminotransferase class V-fold PLP-dependent enzyme n=1 Tax=Pikeienuella piscinae TaxID=2748098 RepID=A0A7L5BUP2_9RHOB|nr:aminotransferase class V-fold PLP-dependent enzyme [Pikeienuella piscinae]QIE55372.1 aminotransferase class V-fold PLP-dependent enzyme [Pikeienuella piscinae]